MLQRKLNYRVEFTFSDTSLEVRCDSVTLPELTIASSSRSNQKFGSIVTTGRATYSNLVVAVPMWVNENSNTSASLLSKLYNLSSVDKQGFDVEVQMIEQVDGEETVNYSIVSANCFLVGLKVDDVATETEEVQRITITMQPRKLNRLSGKEMV
jgi:hypothetical protein